MLVRITFLNWEYEGEVKFLIECSSNSSVSDLQYRLTDLFNIGSCKIFYREYMLMPQSQLESFIDFDCRDKGVLNLQIQVNKNPQVNVQAQANDDLIEKLTTEIRELKQQCQNIIANQQKQQQGQEPNKVQKAQPLPQQKPIQPTNHKQSKAQKLTEKHVQSSDTSSEEEAVQAQKVVQKPKGKTFNRPQQQDSDSESPYRAPLRKQAQPLRVVDKSKAALKIWVPSPVEEYEQKKKTWPVNQKKLVTDAYGAILTPASVPQPEPVKKQQKQQTQQAIQPVQPLTQVPPSNENKEQKPIKIPTKYLKQEVDSLKQNPSILYAGLKVQFKYTFFDVINMEPSVSVVITARVIENQIDHHRVRFMNLRDNKELVLCYTQLIELYTEVKEDEAAAEQNKNHDKIQQEQQFRTNEIANNHQAPAATQQAHNTIQETAKTQEPDQQQTQRQKKIPSNEMVKMIGRQVNYYYSDSNYFKDDFIQQHMDDSKCMQIKLLLKFPKLGKMVSDEETLLEILQKYLSDTKEEKSFIIMEREGVNLIQKSKL